MSADEETVRIEGGGSEERSDEKMRYSGPAGTGGPSGPGHSGSASSIRPIPSDELGALASRLESADNVSGLADWLREVEEIVSAIETTQVGETRNEIRGVIDKLLQINAEVQNVLRLKKLLS